MLHVGKTGGSAVKFALAPFAQRAGIVLHKHVTRISDLPGGDRYFFFLRDPVARFVSAFNSRLRCGRPRLDNRWNHDEERAFGMFKSPTALGEAIGTPDGDYAMRAIGHVRTRFADWDIDIATLERRPPLLIGRQETLDADFDRLKRIIGLPHAALPSDPVERHDTPPGFDTGLSELARRRLERWYADDIALYAALRHQVTEPER